MTVKPMAVMMARVLRVVNISFGGKGWQEGSGTVYMHESRLSEYKQILLGPCGILV
jgi:hypothetical protein